MKILNIKTYKIPEQNVLNKLLSFFAPFLLIPFGIIMLVLIIPLMWLYDKIKTNVFGIKPVEFIRQDNILFCNQTYRLVKEYYDTEDQTKEGEPLYEFFWNFVDDEDEFQIYKIKDTQNESELNNCYITDFNIESENEIILQQLNIENKNVETLLISFKKQDGKVEVIKNTENFILTKYNRKPNLINGYNKTDIIEITAEL